jgi:FkbM family methyltransferase
LPTKFLSLFFIFINKLIKPFGIIIVARNRLQILENIESRKSEFYLQFLSVLPSEKIKSSLELIPYSSSQNMQDLFVISELNFKKNGYYVEFGATNGIKYSNTFMLEKKFNWSGILVEPANVWQDELKNNRVNSAIEESCVWSESGVTLNFSEVKIPELSTITDFLESDFHKNYRRKNKSYSVTTISLNDLLKKHSAPLEIDYLSIDTEGSEFEILSSFDFNHYKISIITCEHNYSKNRTKVYDLLISKGYKRKYTYLSKYDDWYVLDQ